MVEEDEEERCGCSFFPSLACGGFHFEPNCLDLISPITKITCFCFMIALNIHPVLLLLAAIYSFIYVFYLSLYLAAGRGEIITEKK